MSGQQFASESDTLGLGLDAGSADNEPEIRFGHRADADQGVLHNRVLTSCQWQRTLRTRTPVRYMLDSLGAQACQLAFDQRLLASQTAAASSLFVTLYGT